MIQDLEAIIKTMMASGLSEDHEGYLLGRGAKEDRIIELGFWTGRLLDAPIQDADWCRRYGAQGRGEWLDGWLLWPLWSPRGHLLGFAGRDISRKRITRYMLPRAAWNPVWTGMTPRVMERIWQGGDVWVVEGMFDLLPLDWAVPERDVVLASERARLTDKHVEFLRRFCRGRVHMVYDNDETGKKGTHGWVDDTGRQRWGAVRRLERVGLRVRAVPYRGKDPGTVWDRGGAKAMRVMFPA